MMFFRGSYDYAQMNKVEEYLLEKKIRYRRTSFYDGEQITVFDENGRQVWDVVILTAEDVISFIETGKRVDD